MIFESYARNVCNFREKVLANDDEQLGFCRSARAHVSAEPLHPQRGSSRHRDSAHRSAPVGWRVRSLLPGRGHPMAATGRSYAAAGCPAAWLDQEMPGPYASSSGLLSSTGYLPQSNQSACVAVLQSMLGNESE